MIPPWLRDDLPASAALCDRNAHAVLLYGQSGIGKRLVARALARSLLCESPDPARRASGGCGDCGACGWFDQGSHPDFRRIVPEAVAAAEGTSLDDSEGDAPDAEPSEPSGSRTRKAPSREIKVDQVRALHAFLAVGTHRARSRVVLLYPLESLNDVASNALLKMLEEPPPATVFVLVADHLAGIAPTIVSRCQKRFIRSPSIEEATAWLATQGVDDPAPALALAGGAPLAALDAARDAEGLAAHRAFVAFLSRPGVEAAMSTAEAFSRASPARLLRWMQQWLADCLSMRLAGRIRYHPASSSALSTIAATGRIDAMLCLVQRLETLRRTIDHPLNTRLLLETLLIAYVDALAPTE